MESISANVPSLQFFRHGDIDSMLKYFNELKLLPPTNSVSLSGVYRFVVMTLETAGQDEKAQNCIF
jgi:hypothetical protein